MLPQAFPPPNMGRREECFPIWARARTFLKNSRAISTSISRSPFSEKVERLGQCFATHSGKPPVKMVNLIYSRQDLNRRLFSLQRILLFERAVALERRQPWSQIRKTLSPLHATQFHTRKNQFFEPNEPVSRSFHRNL